MSQLATGAAHLTAASGLEANGASFGRHLRTANLSSATIKTDREAVDVFARYLGDQGMRRESGRSAASMSRRSSPISSSAGGPATRPTATTANRYRRPNR